jgi:hypothetical protein
MKVQSEGKEDQEEFNREQDKTREPGGIQAGFGESRPGQFMPFSASRRSLALRRTGSSAERHALRRPKG